MIRRLRHHSRAGIVTIFASLLVACAPAPQLASPSPSFPIAPAPSQTASQAPAATPSPVPTTTTAPPSPTTRAYPDLCSPLEDIPFSELEGLVVNPYRPPPPGSDDPHQGVDFAILDPDFQFAVSGWPVDAVLGGRVAAVILDRFPYGNAVLIETPLETLPADWVTRLELPTPAPPPGLHPALTCPPAELSVTGFSETRSLYALYAHLAEAPSVAAGNTISCGQDLGAVGNSGNALNPHLHLEIRVGPSGAQFSSLAHYLPSASAAEMGNYCLWRVGGYFQPFNPLALLAAHTGP